MLTYEEGRRLVLSHTRPLPIEKRTLAEARGCILARRASARLHMPRFDQSAMDGYAVLVADLAEARSGSPVPLTITDEIPAGDRRRPRLRPGCAIKVFTGSGLPKGTEAVVMREYCHQQDDLVLVELAPQAGDHIRIRGEEFRRGDPILPAGICLSPPAIGVLATFGYTEIAVHRRPRVAVVTMGDELVPVGQKLGPGQIYNSNAFALEAALAELGIDPVATLTVPDDPAQLRQTLQDQLGGCDVLVTAGGASVGDYDFLREAVADIGVRQEFQSLAVKPGKPNYFGTWRPPATLGDKSRRLVFGLPGNPVSALVSFHQLVKPALLSMMGYDSSGQPIVIARLTAACRKRPGRLSWLRGILDRTDTRKGITVEPVDKQGSHMLGGLAGANCLIHFPLEMNELTKGQEVEVLPLSWKE